MVQEKLRFQGTQTTPPVQDVQCLTQLLYKEMSTAAIRKHIRKTLKCNQALPGARGFSGINELCHPVGFRLGKSSIISVRCPCCQKKWSEMLLWGSPSCAHMPQVASLETQKSQHSIPLGISQPVSFVERTGFCETPNTVSQRKPSSGLWIMTILFSMKHKPTWIFFSWAQP